MADGGGKATDTDTETTGPVPTVASERAARPAGAARPSSSRSDGSRTSTSTGAASRKASGVEPTRNTDIVTGKVSSTPAAAPADAGDDSPVEEPTEAATAATSRELDPALAGPDTAAMAPAPAVPPMAGRVPTVVPVPLTPSGAPGPAAAPASAVQAAPATRTGGVRRARLMVSRLDPWSVLKTAFMLSLSFAIILLVATALLWYTLDVLRVFDTLTRTVNDITGTGTTQFDLGAVISFGRVMGVALVLAAFEIILVSVLATMFAFLYNLTVGITGGLEVTLSEES